MNELAAIHAQPTLTSREIADLTGKEHDNVRRDIKNMAAELSLTFEEKAEGGTGGRPSVVFVLSAREVKILVTGYSITLRARVIDRLEQLEQICRQPDPMTVLNDPSAMRGLLLTYSEKVIALEHRVTEQAPKVEAFDRLQGMDGTLCMRDAAKTLQIRPTDLKNLMIMRHWIYGRPGHSGWLAYQNRIQSGYLVHKVATVLREDGTEKIVERVRITPKGLAKLAEILTEGAVAA